MSLFGQTTFSFLKVQGPRTKRGFCLLGRYMTAESEQACGGHGLSLPHQCFLIVCCFILLQVCLPTLSLCTWGSWPPRT